jgi:hypothetical protein
MVGPQMTTTSLGFPASPPAAAAPGNTGIVPPQTTNSPSGTMPMAPGSQPQPHPADAAAIAQHSQQMMPRHFGAMARNRPGFFDRFQALMAPGSPLAGMLAQYQARQQGPAPAPVATPQVRVPGGPASNGTQLAPPPAAAPAPAAAASTIPANYAALSAQNPVVFNPLNLTGIGG